MATKHWFSSTRPAERATNNPGGSVVAAIASLPYLMVPLPEPYHLSIFLSGIPKMFHFVVKYGNMNLGKEFKRLPAILRVVVYLGINYGLLFVAQIISGLIPLKSPLIMNGILCVLLILFTAFILKWEGWQWKDIGCAPTGRRGVTNFLTGVFCGMVMLVTVAFTIKLLAGFQWEVNPAFRWSQSLPILVTVFASVVAQELAFRGYPFHLLLGKWGEWPAQIVLAILFGCMHLSDNMGMADILLTMLTTGIGSLLFGIAVIKTKQIHLAIGIHFGWNLLQFLLPRSIRQNGEGIWIVTGGTFDPSFALLIWILPYVIVALAMFLIIKASIPKKPVETGA